MENFPRSDHAVATLNSRRFTFSLSFLMLSLLIGITGNGLLSIMGFLVSVMVLNGSRAAGPLVPLSTFTAMLSVLQLFMSLGMFAVILVGSPEHFCREAKKLAHYSKGTESEIAASWNETSTREAIPASEGMTATTVRLIAFTSKGAHEPLHTSPSTSPPILSHLALARS